MRNFIENEEVTLQSKDGKNTLFGSIIQHPDSDDYILFKQIKISSTRLGLLKSEWDIISPVELPTKEFAMVGKKGGGFYPYLLMSGYWRNTVNGNVVTNNEVNKSIIDFGNEIIFEGINSN